ncbi:undecaprenyl-diphosphate phosphatase [Leptolyngbyaceae cyanobacterium CCMR0082]|uniref:Undecaprenyl-diphosphatase n=2 Tax=Adonisia turfae TaxID=2950184 RepID=A0A6M0S0E2_9CYAN|nr:undecaprenyl-diphosphate phosphatase [Adonisia turfae]EKV02510.1 Undecaprenyl-diphosphatase [Leptolyngbya sp. PCC 7375]MDV3352385.1 undecaprenyl-diphosphate phosphatase [Leptothoe sp. LEGE 181152]NEZ58926.1 undecaprenyl-diphosphate phosphatase [Adonisia turfae CCMR0081]NEZ61856.1 undecaprenyl-diphosphate phosphatase [Adonisia turfae CCMR0082]
MFVCQLFELLAQAPTSQAAQINLFQAIVIGIVQGLTEFLPISSTAHVKIVPVTLGWGDPGVAFTAVIQLGSLAAILWYFWDDLTKVTRNTIKAAIAKRYQSSDFRLGLGIILGSIPIVLCGLIIKLFFETQYETSVIRSTQAIAITSIVMAVLLGIAEKVGSRKRKFEKLDLWDGVGVGIGQALALVPGVSRSGSTLTAGLFLGLERDTAARFSFLLGTPAILLSGLVELKGLLDEMATVGDASLVPLVGGLIAAVISSYLAIAWLIQFLRRNSTWVFVWYRLAFGVAILIGLATKTIQNV